MQTAPEQAPSRRLVATWRLVLVFTLMVVAPVIAVLIGAALAIPRCDANWGSIVPNVTSILIDVLAVAVSLVLNLAILLPGSR